MTRNIELIRHEQQTQTSTKSKTNQGLSEPRAPRGKPKATLNKRKATDDDPIRDFSQVCSADQLIV
jgi:hypothetical protein